MGVYRKALFALYILSWANANGNSVQRYFLNWPPERLAGVGDSKIAFRTRKATEHAMEMDIFQVITSDMPL